MNIRDLEFQAERQKLARLLEVDEAQLTAYEALGLDGMRALPKAINARIFDLGARKFAGLAKSSGLLPGRVSALIAEKALGPRIAAQVTGLLEPKQAVALASHVSFAFQAEICLYLDPRRAGPVLRAMPESIVLATSRELVRRKEYITMARFVEDLLQEQIDAVSAILEPVAMLWIGFYVESDERLSQLIAGLGDERLLAISEAAAAHQYWPQALALMARVNDATVARMTRVLVAGGEKLNLDLLQAAEALNLWDGLFEIMRRADAEVLEQQAKLLEAAEPAAVARLRTGLSTSMASTTSTN